ncbi:hypothetical protein [Nocardia sp. AG03]|uniref:hypothetical protein n=1 Tax=Nocardia sp. AG03 TaxID=3025312 RepID=UPI0024183F62|nr:hypothetical protein [Nocardia sp. AG03]
MREATRRAGGAGLALAAVLLICSLGLVVSGLNTSYLIVVCVVALLPGILGLGLLSGSRRILRGEIQGAVYVTGLLATMAGLAALGTVGALIEGPWGAKIVMVTLLAATIGTAVLVNRAERALKGQ